MNRLVALVAITLCLIGVARADPDGLYECHKPSPDTKIALTFKPDTSIYELAVWFMGFTCKNVVFSTDVAKHAMKLNIIAPKPMSPKQAAQLFVDAIDSTGLVVVDKNDSMIIKLGPGMPKTCPDVAAAPALPPTTTALPAASDEQTAADEAEDLHALETGIRKIDDTHVEIARGVIDRIILNPMQVARTARLVPAVRDGKPSGFKLYSIRPGSLFARLGLINGDTVRAVNGLDLTSPDKALEVYTKLREAKKLELELERRGKPFTLTITVK